MDQTFNAQATGAIPFAPAPHVPFADQVVRDHTFEHYIRQQEQKQHQQKQQQQKHVRFAEPEEFETEETPSPSALKRMAISFIRFILRLPLLLFRCALYISGIFLVLVLITAVAETMSHGNFRKHQLQGFETALRALSKLVAQIEFQFGTMIRYFGVRGGRASAVEAFLSRVSDYLDDTHVSYCLSVFADELFCFRRRTWANSS